MACRQRISWKTVIKVWRICSVAGSLGWAEWAGCRVCLVDREDQVDKVGCLIVEYSDVNLYSKELCKQTSLLQLLAT